MTDITEWVSAYGINPENSRARTFIFPEVEEQEIRNIYREFLKEVYEGKDKSTFIKPIFCAVLIGDEKPTNYESAITFPTARKIGEDIEITIGKRNEHLSNLFEYLLKNKVKIAERLPYKLSSKTKWKIKQGIINSD